MRDRARQKNQTDKRAKNRQKEIKTKVATKCKWRKTLKAIKFHANKLIKTLKTQEKNTERNLRRRQTKGI